MAVATPIWTFVFRSKRANFWVRMTAGAGALGSYGLWARPEQRKELPTLKDALIGAASAGGLYVIFQIGDRLARRIMPAGTEEIASVYELRGKAPTPLITAAAGRGHCARRGVVLARHSAACVYGQDLDRPEAPWQPVRPTVVSIWSPVT